jgi:hypothetical protein
MSWDRNPEQAEQRHRNIGYQLLGDVTRKLARGLATSRKGGKPQEKKDQMTRSGFADMYYIWDQPSVGDSDSVSLAHFSH